MATYSDSQYARRKALPYGESYQNYVRKLERRDDRRMADTDGWTKGFNINLGGTTSMFDNIGKLILYGGAAFLAIYVLLPDTWAKMSNAWCKWTGGTNCNETATPCPDGYHSESKCEGFSGLPKMLCDMSAFITGGFGECVKDDGGGVTPQPCTLTDNFCKQSLGVCQQVNIADCSCERIPGCTADLTEAQILTNKLNAGQCVNWDEMLWMVRNEPYLANQFYAQGLECKSFTNFNAGVTQCTADYVPGSLDWAACMNWVSAMYNSGNDGGSNLQQCSNGTWVDLNNPPGTTLEQACQGSGALPVDCFQRHVDCAYLQVGAGGGFGFRTDIPCPSQYPIELEPGVCVNQKQVDYTNCMEGCGT